MDNNDAEKGTTRITTAIFKESDQKCLTGLPVTSVASPTSTARQKWKGTGRTVQAMFGFKEAGGIIHSKKLSETRNLQRQALTNIFCRTGGPDWFDNDGWCSENFIGNWFGVICNSEGNVVQLVLNENNLTGKFTRASYFYGI